MPKVVPEAALTEPCPWGHMGTSYDDLRRDPLATPRRTPGWPVSNGCVTAVKTLFTPISHK